MMKPSIISISLICCCAPQGLAQITLSGQTAAEFYQSARTSSPRTVNAGRPSFGWETEVFLDATVSDRIVALSSIRASEDRQIVFDQVAVRINDVSPLRVSLQAGKFDLPFGNLGERRYPRWNPLFGLPLIYEYRTGLPNYATTDLLANRGLGKGMRLLDLGMYGLGAMVFGSEGILEYAFSITSGMVSSTSYQTPNSVGDLAKIIRLAVTPTTGLTIGGAYAWGSYLQESDTPSPAYSSDETYVQKSVEVDVAYSGGHFVFYGEGVYNVWPAPLQPKDENLKVFGYTCEGKYTLFPRFSVALRVSGLVFGNAVLESVSQPWDYDVTEWEGGFGYFIDRNAVLKLVRRETRTHGGTYPKDHLTALQLSVSY